MFDTLELCRWTYNETLTIRKNAYEQDGKSVSYYETKSSVEKGKARTKISPFTGSTGSSEER